VYEVASSRHTAYEEEELVENGLYSRRQTWQENWRRGMRMEGIEEEEEH